MISESLQRYNKWLCSKIGHSFSWVQRLKFALETAGRCYIVDVKTGERRRFDRQPQIKCRRCKQLVTEIKDQQQDEDP